MMRKEEFDSINKLENSHWWYVGTREICVALLEKFLPKTALTILDIGCGTGGNMQRLAKYGTVEGFDIDAYTVDLCNQKGLNCSVLDVQKAELSPEKYDVITFFDVFNQVKPENQAQTLHRVYKGIKNGGLLAMREPAMSIAGGRHDIEVNIQIRFDKKYMQALLTKAGFKVLYIGYINSLLFIPIVLKRKLELALSNTPKSDVQETNSVLNSALLTVLRIENLLLKFVKMPFGVSLFVVAQK